MRFFLSISLCLSFIAGFSQDQPYSDYRRKNETFAHVYDKEIKADLASFTIGGIEESLGKTPPPKLNLSSYSDDSIHFSGDNLIVSIRAAVFFPTKHKLLYEGKYLVKIDGKPYYGGYSKLPANSIGGITVILGKDSIQIPASAYSDLHNISFGFRNAAGSLVTQDAVYLSKDKRRIYIYMLCRGEIDNYEVTWVIQDKQYLRRILDFGFNQ
jgi:hypothetical protein